MDDLDVRIVELELMRVASYLGFGESPEVLAWEKLFAWARPEGLLEDPETYRLFGFNNPDPSPGSPNYGYEVWMTIAPDVAPGGEGRVVDFEGGKYAVTRCEVPEGNFDVIGQTWKKLVAWREDSPYRCGTHQWLEESLPETPPGMEFVLDLYLPIAE
jgi:DNA gyrase inhibitor GyrI